MIKAIVEVCEFNVEKSGVAGAGFSADVTLTEHSHLCVGMCRSVRVDRSPFTLNGVTSSFAELNYGSVGFPCVAFHALLAARVEECSTFREAMHASANQIAFHA